MSSLVLRGVVDIPVFRQAHHGECLAWRTGQYDIWFRLKSRDSHDITLIVSMKIWINVEGRYRMASIFEGLTESSEAGEEIENSHGRLYLLTKPGQSQSR